MPHKAKRILKIHSLSTSEQLRNKAMNWNLTGDLGGISSFWVLSIALVGLYVCDPRKYFCKNSSLMIRGRSVITWTSIFCHPSDNLNFAYSCNQHLFTFSHSQNDVINDPPTKKKKQVIIVDAHQNASKVQNRGPPKLKTGSDKFLTDFFQLFPSRWR